MEDLRDYTLGAVREEMKKEDTELEAKMADLQFLTMANLDVSEVCQKNEEVMKVENRLSFAEQSLEAYKKEMETFLKDKLNLEAEKKAACEKAEALQSHFEVVTRCVNEL